MLSRRTIIFLGCLALQACGSLPQPFRPLPDSSNRLLTNPSGVGVGILPPAGIDDDVAAYMASWIATDLQRREILAEAVGRAGTLGFTLEGNLRDETRNGLETVVYFDWRLLNRSGEIVRRLNQSTTVETTAWLNSEVSTHNQIASNIASELAMMIAPQVEGPARQEPVSQWANVAVTIQRPQNAPGDGAQALGVALANRLGAEGFKPATDNPDIVLGAVVEVIPFDSAQDDISVIWQVLAPSGEMLGEVRLDNRIPRGDLDGAWGPVAGAIVDAGLPGILDIIGSTLESLR